MAYQVFISHSTKDREIIVEIARSIQSDEIKAYVAEWDITPGVDLPRKVKNQIKRCDCVVVILTKRGTRSQWVHQEIGCANGLDKLVIPFVEKGVKVKGFIGSREYIEFDRSDPDSLKDAMDDLGDYLGDLHEEKKAGQTRGLWILGGIVLLSLLFPGNDKDDWY